MMTTPKHYTTRPQRVEDTLAEMLEYADAQFQADRQAEQEALRTLKRLAERERAACDSVQGRARFVLEAHGHKGAQFDFGWLCDESPIGHCAYAPQDRCQDECLFCGAPNERK